MKKKILALLATGAAVSMAFGLAACGDTAEYVTVTYMDGTQIIKTEKVKKGEAPEGFTPTKDGGYEFVNWFATPSKNHIYDMSAVVNENVTVYAGFSKYEADVRDFYIVGAGTSSILIDGWGNINDSHKFTKTEGKNEYKLTLDLLAGDQFVLIAGVNYESKRGAGYLTTSKLADGTEVFGGAGSVYDESAKGKNIEVKYSGNYTLTLNTYPGDDYYNTAGEGYTEDRKEIYRVGTYDTINWVRNGDPQVTTISVTDYFIKGSGISNWKNYANDAHLMAREGDNYSLSIYLKAGEQFMFTSRDTVTEQGKDPVVSYDVSFIKSNNLDEESRKVLDGYTETGANMVAKASGMYTFNYNKATGVLSVTCDTEAVEMQYDYYLDGKWGTQNWKAETLGEHKLTGENGVYTITAELKKGDIIAVRSYPVGAELVAGYAGHVAVYGSKFAILSDAFKDNYNNVEVVTAGTYDITFDNYSKILTITEHSEDGDIYDIYLKGSQWGTGWALLPENVFKQSESDANVYELTVDIAANTEFGFSQYAKGDTANQIAFINTGFLGTAGDANSVFGTSGNFKCTTAGKYKIVYNTETQKIDFYAVA